MEYSQTETDQQLTLFTDEILTTLTKSASIPIYKISLVREGEMSCNQQRVRSSADTSRILQIYLSDVDREFFVVVMLNQKHVVLGIHTVSIGSLTASVVHPRETYEAVLLSNAAAVILGHNHPSGDPLPSQEDRAITKRLSEAGELLGVKVLDHIIVGEERYFSFADEGIL